MQSKARKLCIAMSLATICIGGTSFAAIEPGYITPHDSNLTGSMLSIRMIKTINLKCVVS